MNRDTPPLARARAFAGSVLFSVVVQQVQPGLGHAPPSLSVARMAPVEAAVQKPMPVGFSLLPSHPVAVESRCCMAHWEPPTRVVLRDVIRAEAAAASKLLSRSVLLGRCRTRTCSKGLGVGGCLSCSCGGSP